MPKLKIFTFPDLVLGQKAAPIARVEKSFFKLADDMLETMYDAPGVGLAANQIGLLQKILVIDTDYEVEEEAEEKSQGLLAPSIVKKNPRIIINPELIYHEGSKVFSEGCLSVPDFNADVKRFEKVKIRFQDVDGVTRELSAEGLLAVAIQHEMDHLEGRLFIDRLSPLKKEMIRKKLRQARLEREQDEKDGLLEGGDSKKRKGF